MDMVDVEVHILPRFGAPDFSLTAKQLGARLAPLGRVAGHGGQPGEVWEVVRLVNGKVKLDPQDVAQTGKCNFVNALAIRVDFALEYFIASDLQNNISNAPNIQVKNFYGLLLLKIKQHANEHYEQYIKEITDWEWDIKNSLMKTLPTQQNPTSQSVLEIKNAIGALVSDWFLQLDYRLKLAAYNWENTDYPRLSDWMKSQPGVFMPQGLAIPPAPQKPAPPRPVIFPPCRL
jgi:hypothetical protein